LKRPRPPHCEMAPLSPRLWPGTVIFVAARNCLPGRPGKPVGAPKGIPPHTQLIPAPPRRNNCGEKTQKTGETPLVFGGISFSLPRAAINFPAGANNLYSRPPPPSPNAILCFRARKFISVRFVRRFSVFVVCCRVFLLGVLPPNCWAESRRGLPPRKLGRTRAASLVSCASFFSRNNLCAAGPKAFWAQPVNAAPPLRENNHKSRGHPTSAEPFRPPLSRVQPFPSDPPLRPFPARPSSESVPPQRKRRKWGDVAAICDVPSRPRVGDFAPKPPTLLFPPIKQGPSSPSVLPRRAREPPAPPANPKCRSEKLTGLFQPSPPT